MIWLTYYTFFFFFLILPIEINGAWYRWLISPFWRHSEQARLLTQVVVGGCSHTTARRITWAMVGNNSGVACLFVYRRTLLYGVNYCVSPRVLVKQCVYCVCHCLHPTTPAPAQAASWLMKIVRMKPATAGIYYFSTISSTVFHHVLWDRVCIAYTTDSLPYISNGVALIT